MRAWLCLAIAWSACSDDPSPTEDGGISFDAQLGDASFPEPLAPAAPEPPRAAPAPTASPVMTPCPSGWRLIDIEGVAACDPWPADGRAACSGAEAHFPGEASCRRIGSDCAADGWPAGLPATAVLYVRAGAASGGSGTRDAPFATIGEALAAAAAGTVVAIAPATYTENLSVPAGVTIFGACASETTLASAGGADAVIVALGPDVVVRNLRVTGTDQGGIWSVDPTASVLVRDVIVEDVVIAGVYGFGADVTLEDVVIRRVGGAPGSGANGRGLHVHDGALIARRAVVEDAREIGIYVGAGSAMLEDVAVVGTQPQASDDLRGTGLHAQEGAELAVSQSTFEDNHGFGVTGGGPGIRIALTDVVVRRTAVSEETSRGIDVESGAALVLSRVLVQDHEENGIVAIDATIIADDVIVTGVGPRRASHAIAMQQTTGSLSRALVLDSFETGIFARGLQTEVTLADIAVRRVRGRSVTEGGRGLAAQEGARVTASRVIIEDAEGTGVLAGAPDTELALTDLVVRSSGAYPYARGVSSVLGARATVQRAIVEGFDEIGLYAERDGAFLRAEDIVLRDPTGTGIELHLGRGVAAQEGSRLELARASIERVVETGIACTGPDALCRIEDVRIEDVTPSPAGEFGRGVNVQSGAEMDLARAVITRATEAAVHAQGEATVLRASDLVVRETRSAAGDHLGRGVFALDRARIEVSRALLERNRELGACAFARAYLSLSDTIVRETLARPCADDVCAGYGAGIGVGGYLEGHVSLRRFVVEDGALAGFQIARDGSIDAAEGVVRRNPIGANVQVPGYDLARIAAEVRYEDNDRNLDATELAVPGL